MFFKKGDTLGNMGCLGNETGTNLHIGAREMFEKLGFKRYEEKQYIKYERIRDDDITEISFVIEIKSLYTTLRYISSDLLKAINKQIEELGWD